MADRILGLPTTDKLRNVGAYFGDHRRTVLWLCTNAGLPLAGLTSMIPGDSISDVTCTWYEKRYTTPGSTTRGTNPLTSTEPSTGDADDGTVASGTLAVATSYYLKVNSIVDYSKGTIISLLPNGVNTQFRVTAVTSGVSDTLVNGYLKLNPVRAVTYASGTYTAGTVVAVVGDAHGEGTSSTAGLGLKYPYPITNYAQFFRTSYSLPETTIRVPQIYNKEGPWRDRSRDAAVEHFGKIEAAVLFGRRSLSTTSPVLSASDSDMSYETVGTLGGLFEQMALYDAGSTGLTINGATYAPYAFKSAVTADSDPRKIVIANSAGTVSYDNLSDWFVRANTTVRRTSGDRMGITSNYVMQIINKMARQESMSELKMESTDYGFDVTTLILPTGKLHLTTHPFWNDPSNRYGLKNSLLICDPQSMRMREFYPTKKCENIQSNDSTTRKDEFRSLFTVEYDGIESNVFIQNITAFQKSI